jgi:outer membrane immunogenic protein
MKRFFAMLAALALLSTPVVAQTEARSWTGFFLGLHGGLDASAIGVDAGPLGIDGLSANGVAFGAHGGFDWHLPGSPLVVGIGADATVSNAEFTVSPGILSAAIERSYSAYARLGMSLGDVLPYVLAGYSWADAKATLGGASASEDLQGFMVGGGVEFRLAPGVTLAGEYRYTKFDDVTVIPGFVSLEPERHEVRAAVRYRF